MGPGCKYLVCTGTLLTVECSMSFRGHSVHFQLSTTLYLENSWSQSETDHNLYLGYKVLSVPGTQGTGTLTFKCIGSFSAFPIFDNLVSQKERLLGQQKTLRANKVPYVIAKLI